MNVCMCTHKQLREIFMQLTSWTCLFFFKVVDLSLCILCAPTADIVLDPKDRMKAAEDPSTFWFALQGKIIIAPLGGPARSPEGPDRTRKVSQKPIKQQLFPVHYIKVCGMITRQINTDRKREFSWMIQICETCLHWLDFPSGQSFIHLDELFFSLSLSQISKNICAVAVIRGYCTS